MLLSQLAPVGALFVFEASQFQFSSTDGSPKTLFDKIWSSHVVGAVEGAGDASIIYIDRHLVHEVTSPQALRVSRTRAKSPPA